MNKNNNKMDLLGNAPVPQALMALGIPIMIGMLINALYNLVDAYFIRLSRILHHLHIIQRQSVSNL